MMSLSPPPLTPPLVTCAREQLDIDRQVSKLPCDPSTSVAQEITCGASPDEIEDFNLVTLALSAHFQALE